MAKSMRSPDWTDIEVMIRAIDVAHGGKTGVLFSPRGTGATGGLHIVIMTDFGALPNGLGAEGCLSESDYPCRDCGSLEAHVYQGLYKHDYAVAMRYQQNSWTK